MASDYNIDVVVLSLGVKKKERKKERKKKGEKEKFKT